MYLCVLTLIFFQSLIAHSREKSQFVREQKEKWDRLAEEARLHGDVSTQLAVTQQRVAELTPLAKEKASVLLREAKARRDAEDAEKSFEELSERARQGEEEAARVWKEWDELLQRDAETRQWILDLLAKAKKERELKLGAKERFADLQQRVNQDAKAVT